MTKRRESLSLSRHFAPDSQQIQIEAEKRYTFFAKGAMMNKKHLGGKTMQQYAIITDSSCDLTQELADQKELQEAPLSLRYKAKE